MLKDIHPGAGDSTPANLTRVNGTLFFTANDGVHGIELWKSDGTAVGTVLVKDIYPGAPDSSPSSLANANGALLFAANDGVTGRELWKSRGTAATTVLEQNIAAGPGDSAPAGFTIMGTDVFFSASDDTARCAELRADGQQPDGCDPVEHVRNWHADRQRSGGQPADLQHRDQRWQGDGADHQRRHRGVYLYAHSSR
jgi:ELWxxDGT repeat protein